MEIRSLRCISKCKQHRLSVGIVPDPYNPLLWKVKHLTAPQMQEPNPLVESSNVTPSHTTWLLSDGVELRVNGDPENGVAHKKAPAIK